MLIGVWQADVDDEADASSTPPRSRIFRIIARRALHAKGVICVYCGILLTFEKRINLDPSTPLIELHIVPSNSSMDAATSRCHGGEYTEENLRLCCHRISGGESTRLLLVPRDLFAPPPSAPLTLTSPPSTLSCLVTQSFDGDSPRL